MSLLPHPWWQAPFVFGAPSIQLTGATGKLEETLGNLSSGSNRSVQAEVHFDGVLTPTSCSGPSRMGLARTLRRLARPGSRSYAFLTVSPRQWRQLLLGLGLSTPEWTARTRMPESECAGALAAANQSMLAFEKLLRWRLLALGGSAGGGMHLHVDSPPVSNVHLQVRGRKRWALCPPRPDASSFYCAGSANAFARLPADALFCPEFSNTSCYDAVLRPGESLFYPSRWWHQTQTLDDGTASLSKSFITAGDASSFAPAMQQLCTAAERLRSSSHVALCKALSPCLSRMAQVHAQLM